MLNTTITTNGTSTVNIVHIVRQLVTAQFKIRKKNSPVFLNKNLAITNRSRVSCAHNMSTASIVNP